MSDPFSLIKNSTDPDLLFSKIWLQGIVMRGIFYGMVFALCCSCIHLLMSKRSRSSHPPQSSWMFAYVSFLLLLSTAVMVLGGIQNEEAYIYHSDYPGGPAAFITLGDSSAIPIAQSICFILLHWTADGLLIWRCFAFFAGMSSYTIIIQIFLGIIVVLDIGLSILFVLCNTPMTLGSKEQQLKILLAYSVFTMVLNVSITTAISTKLIRHNRFVAPLLGQNSTGYHFDIVSILVESAAALAIHNVFFIVPTAIRHPLSFVGYHIGIMVQVIPPLMIIQRVARGVAWQREHRNPNVARTMKRSPLVFGGQTQCSDTESLPASTFEV